MERPAYQSQQFSQRIASLQAQNPAPQAAGPLTPLALPNESADGAAMMQYQCGLHHPESPGTSRMRT